MSGAVMVRSRAAQPIILKACLTDGAACVTQLSIHHFSEMESSSLRHLPVHALPYYHSVECDDAAGRLLSSLLL